MRAAEWISVAFFSLFLAWSALVPLERAKRWKVIGIGVAGILAACSLQVLGSQPTARVLRDLLPGLFLLMVYWQSGQFFRGSDARVQAFLVRIDDRWFPSVRRIASSLESRRWLSTYLETAYLMCYPVVPLGITALYAMGHQDAVDYFWTVVLPPSYACYVFTVLFQSLPPRLVERDAAAVRSRSNLRSLNFWVLRRAGIRANTLPSGHAANSFAIALVLLKLVPVLGLAFLWVAASIAMATAILRYHYSVDTVLGIALGLLSFGVFG